MTLERRPKRGGPGSGVGQQQREIGGIATSGDSLFNPQICPNEWGHLFAVPTAHPMVTATLAGIRREAKETLPRQKTALTWDRLVRVVEAISHHDLVGARDRAILLLGFAGAFRRSKLAALKVDDITVDEDGLQIRLGRSKGDPQRKGTLIGIPRGLTRNCPVLAYETWLRQAGITEGPVFRRIWSARGHRAGTTPVEAPPRIGPHALSDRAVTDIIRKRCGDTHLEGDFGGHSLRRGRHHHGGERRV